MEGESTLIGAYVGLGIGSCIGMVLLAWNVFGVIQYFRLKGQTPEGSSVLGLVAWFLGFSGLFLGPCAIGTAVIAFILAGMEKGKVYREEAPPMTLFPCQLAQINALATLLVGVIVTIVAVLMLV